MISSLSPSCARGRLPFAAMPWLHAACEDLMPDGSGCACECHAALIRELRAVELPSLDNWHVNLAASGCCNDDGYACQPELQCGMLLPGRLWGRNCACSFEGATLSELRRSIAHHLLTSSHVILEKDGDRNFKTVRRALWPSAPASRTGS